MLSDAICICSPFFAGPCFSRAIQTHYACSLSGAHKQCLVTAFELLLKYVTQVESLRAHLDLNRLNKLNESAQILHLSQYAAIDYVH